MSSKGNHFVLYMFQQDLENMKQWVLQYPNNETGGDLFGLWSGEGDNAVIHVVLGPGRDCTHGDYHFYQDVNYLEKVGSLLTENYMLGHIGEWHSHHQLKLDRPSEGDCSTIQRNFPQGSCGFFLMIANIVSKDEVSFSPYIFKENSRRCRAGYVEEISIKSPFSLISDISLELEKGKEAEKVVAPRNELEKEEHKQKSFLGDIKDKVVNIIFGQEPVESYEGKKLFSNSSSPSASASESARGMCQTSTAYRVTFPSNYSSLQQWYSKEESHAVIKDIYCGLSKFVGKIEITFDEDYYKDMNMTFVYHGHEVSVSFSRHFPSCSASLKVNKKFLDLIYLRRCTTIQSFKLDEFLDEVFKLLQNRLSVNDSP